MNIFSVGEYMKLDYEYKYNQEDGGMMSSICMVKVGLSNACAPVGSSIFSEIMEDWEGFPLLKYCSLAEFSK